ncbi:hypothetical protein AB0G04_29875 [Actinoplanes sp. NPDC023801]|uniref:hypothetical protein n=1 Tax=Actinoplanes sp. NPDC023801 TaxID=3154595 RepID=UPI0033EC1802
MIVKRRQKSEPAAAIAAFWAWWAAARPRAEKMIEGAPDDGLIEEIAGLVSAIHPDLHWEFAAGTSSRHLLVVSSGGSAELRSLAERWRRAGPPPDETFGYAAARQGRPDALDSARLSIGGHDLDLADLRFRAEHDDERDWVDVEVWHPAFAQMRSGKPILAMAQTRLRPARWPEHDLHIRMDVAVPGPGRERVPGPGDDARAARPRGPCRRAR